MFVSQNGLSRLHDQLQPTVHRVLLLLLHSQNKKTNQRELDTTINKIRKNQIRWQHRPGWKSSDCSLGGQESTTEVIHSFSTQRGSRTEPFPNVRMTTFSGVPPNVGHLQRHRHTAFFETILLSALSLRSTRFVVMSREGDRALCPIDKEGARDAAGGHFLVSR